MVGALMLSDYFVLRGRVDPAAAAIFASATLKTLALSAVYFFVLVPVGVLAWRRPRAGRYL